MEKSSEFIEFVETTAKVLVAETKKDKDKRSILIISSEECDDETMNGLSAMSGSAVNIVELLINFMDSNKEVAKLFFHLSKPKNEIRN